jgi:hypothetical protein
MKNHEVDAPGARVRRTRGAVAVPQAPSPGLPPALHSDLVRPESAPDDQGEDAAAKPTAPMDAKSVPL